MQTMYVDDYVRTNGRWYFARRLPLYWYATDLNKPPIGPGKMLWPGTEPCEGNFQKLFPTFQEYWSRTGDYYGAGNGPGLIQMWWADSAKAAELDAARRDPSKKMEVGSVEDRYWIDYDAKQRSEKPVEGGK